MNINSSEISVVVQGAINMQWTKTVLKSIRKHLPKAEIILSTWKGSTVFGYDFDILVENEDPGAEIIFPLWGVRDNVNRQIVSTKNGLKQATRKYVLKTRTDILFNNNNFLKYFDKYNERCEQCKILEKRVVTCQHFARRPEVFPFHPGDWVFFGLREDILKIWDIPLLPEPESSKWFYNHELTEQQKTLTPYSHFRCRYCPEQYIWSTFLKKYMNFNFDNLFDITEENIELTNISFANNLVIISDKDYGIKFVKWDTKYEDNIYYFMDWLELYKKYCAPDLKISKLQKALYAPNVLKYSYEIKNYAKSFFAPIITLLKYLELIPRLFVNFITIIFSYIGALLKK